MGGAGAGGGTDCRALVDRAMVRTYGQLANLQSLHPLGSAHDGAEYERGMITGIDNETQLALQHLLAERVCGSGPIVVTHRAGVEVGRQVLAEAIGGVLADGGSGAAYPDRLHLLPVCEVEAAVLAPARRLALEGIAAAAERFLLCPGHAPADPAEAALLQRLADRYLEGIRRGVLCELSRGAELLFLAVPCVPGGAGP